MTYQILTKSKVMPVEAGRGLTHTDTIVATTEDELIVTPSGTRLELEIGGKKTSGALAHLGLVPGMYDGVVRTLTGENKQEEKKIKLLLVSPSRVCRAFGARYGSLEYDLPVITGVNKTASWASLWKTNEFADIIVDFNAPYKFVLWRGMAFAPSWVMNNVMTSNFFVETLEPGVYRDCCEMMSDRECRYVHARIIHNSAARAVIHWRYALCDTAYTICRNLWVDELFYVYPDGVAVRNATLHLDPKDEAFWQIDPQTGRRMPCAMISGSAAGKKNFNDMEFITVNAPGATSDDNTPLDAMTLMDGKDFSRTYRWPHPPDFTQEPMPQLGEYIFKMNYRNRLGNFVASHAQGMKFRLERNDRAVCYKAGARVEEDHWVRVPEIPSNFIDCIHWPVTRGYGTTPLTDPAQYRDRPTHTFVGYANNAPAEVCDDGAVTWSWLCGMAPEEDDILRKRVMGWIEPVQIEGTRYLPRQAAYLVKDWNTETALRIESKREIIRPTFILNNPENASVSIRINGRLPDGNQVLTGMERTLDAVQTIFTFQQNIKPATTIQFAKT